MPQTILVVEDDRNIMEVVTEYLKDAGYYIKACADGDAALELLERTPELDFFIFDIMLPGASGLTLLTEIRRSDWHRDKPVMMLTALDDEASQLLSFGALADDYVTKPFSPKVLVGRVGALLRRSGKGNETFLVGNLVLNLASHEATQNGQTLRLTPREFELLGVLMQNAGKVLDRQQLLNHAWGYDYFGDERIVDVHIKNLRKKLEGEVIHTIKGVGYKIDRGDV